MAKNNDTKSLLKLLKHYQMMLGYIANQADGCINAIERKGFERMSRPAKRRHFIEQSRKLLNDYLMADDDGEA